LVTAAGLTACSDHAHTAARPTGAASPFTSSAEGAVAHAGPIAKPKFVPARFGGKGGGGNGPQPGDDYPAQWRAPVAPDSVFDSWLESNRECTSFVAWALHSRNGFDMPFNADAKNWGTSAAAHYTVDGKPAVGAVAWSDAGAFGHVAWVAEVSGSTVTIEEYNFHYDWLYGWRTVASSAFRYIHFKDLATPKPPPAPTQTVIIQQPGNGNIQAGGAPGTGLQGGSAGGSIQGGGTIQIQGSTPTLQAPPTHIQGGGGGAGGGSTPTTTAPPPPPNTMFGVQNTSETLPDGVWFRNSPHVSDTDRMTGHGVYAGDQVRLQCYAYGDAVGPYANTIWYYVSNLTRPIVSSDGQANVGYLNAHYVNDGKASNVLDPGIPHC
jgi:surface antigen